MPKVDLDKLERRIFDYIQGCDFEENLLATIKELKAAREVVLSVKHFTSEDANHGEDCAYYGLTEKTNGPCDCGLSEAQSAIKKYYEVINAKD